MNLIEALKKVHEDNAVIVLDRKRIRTKDRGTGLFSMNNYIELEQSLRKRSNNKEWIEWDGTEPQWSLEEIESTEWQIWKEEKLMSFQEALVKLVDYFDEDKEAVIYQKGNYQWKYKLMGDSIPSLYQRRVDGNWADPGEAQFTKDMLTENDWIVELQESKKEDSKDSTDDKHDDCDHEACKAMRRIFGF